MCRDSFFEGSDFNTLLSSLIANQNGLSKSRFNYIIEENFDWEQVQNIYKINLYRIIQEALLNIHKYSKALNVDVKIQLLENKILKLSIMDDGVGFDINAGKKGIGLSNIKERTNSLKGNLDIRTGIGKGSEIIVRFEIAR